MAIGYGTGNSFSDIYRIPFGPSDATIRASTVGRIDGDHLQDIATVDEIQAGRCTVLPLVISTKTEQLTNAAAALHAPNVLYFDAFKIKK
jgi:hypothetical protein